MAKINYKTKLEIDYREKKLINGLSVFFNSNDNPNLNSEDGNNKNDNNKDGNVDTGFETKNLLLGDIVFKCYSTTLYIKETEETEESKQEQQQKLHYEMIIERKNVDDLVSSIKDNRYKEQKQRLIAEVNNNSHKTEIVYLIEGTASKLRNAVYNKKIFHGSIISLLFRENIKLLFTENINETAELVYRIFTRLEKKPTEFFDLQTQQLHHNKKTNEPVIQQQHQQQLEELDNGNETTKTIDVSLNRRVAINGGNIECQIKRKKNENITPANCGILMLTYIPGISAITATEILKHFNNKLCNLVDFINGSKYRFITLSEYKITTSTGKERKIGEVLARKIFEYLSGKEIDDNKIIEYKKKLKEDAAKKKKEAIKEKTKN